MARHIHLHLHDARFTGTYSAQVGKTRQSITATVIAPDHYTATDLMRARFEAKYGKNYFNPIYKSGTQALNPGNALRVAAMVGVEEDAKLRDASLVSQLKKYHGHGLARMVRIVTTYNPSASLSEIQAAALEAGITINPSTISQQYYKARKEDREVDAEEARLAKSRGQTVEQMRAELRRKL